MSSCDNVIVYFQIDNIDPEDTLAILTTIITVATKQVSNTSFNYLAWLHSHMFR